MAFFEAIKNAAQAILQSKTVTAGTSATTVTPDSGYDGLSSVTVDPQVHTTTYTANTKNAALDMGEQHNNRYVNTNGVPNANSGTYTFAANDTGGTKDMGEANSYRYVNAANVYEKGAIDALLGNIGSGTPTMTSDTAPSGQVIYSSQFSGQPAYYAFDKNSNTNWSNSNTTYSNAYIGYKFASAHKCLVAKFTQRNLSGYDNGPCVAKYQGSNNGSSWTDLTDNLSFYQLGTSVLNHMFTKNIGSYQYYRLLYISSTQSGLNPTTAGLDFIYL